MVERAGPSDSTDGWERAQRAARTDPATELNRAEAASWLARAAATSRPHAITVIHAPPTAPLSPEALAHLSGQSPRAHLSAPERMRAREQRDLGELRAQLAKLGDTSGCRDGDTVASLTLRVQALTAERVQAKDEKDGERLSIGLDGRSGTRDGLDDYETAQWAAAVNPGSGTGVIFAAAATMRGGSLADVRAAGQMGNQLEDLAGGVGVVLNAARPPLELEGRRAASGVARVDDFNAGGALRTKPMLDHFAANPATGKLGEHQRGNALWPGQRVEYLTSDAARAPFKLEVREVEVAGKKERRLIDAQGRLFDTREAVTIWSRQSGVPRAIFVMNARGELFASTYQKRGEFHHSSLAGGQDVAAAGEISVVHGKVVDISNNSGHYQPGDEKTEQVVAALRARGVDVAGVRVLDVAKGTTRVIR